MWHWVRVWRKTRCIYDRCIAVPNSRLSIAFFGCRRTPDHVEFVYHDLGKHAQAATSYSIGGCRPCPEGGADLFPIGNQTRVDRLLPLSSACPVPRCHLHTCSPGCPLFMATLSRPRHTQQDHELSIPSLSDTVPAPFPTAEERIRLFGQDPLILSNDAQDAVTFRDGAERSSQPSEIYHVSFMPSISCIMLIKAAQRLPCLPGSTGCLAFCS